jgi:hypothetical protein
MSKIINTYVDQETGLREARYGSWRVRVRMGGVAFDAMSTENEKWSQARPEHLGLSLDEAARLLEIPRGDLYTWSTR